MIESEGCLASLIRDLELVNVPPSNDTEDGAKSDCINKSSDHFRMFKFKVSSATVFILRLLSLMSVVQCNPFFSTISLGIRVA